MTTTLDLRTGRRHRTLVARSRSSSALRVARAESAFGLIVAAEPTLDASPSICRVVGVKVREILQEWPPGKWTAEDGTNGGPSGDPGELRLLWFSTPDEDGWFSLTATDSQGASWSTYCRTPNDTVWRALERTLGASLKEQLQLVGDLELDAVTRPNLR